MKTSAMCFLSVSMLVAGSIALSGCGRSPSNPTNISYQQVGICKGYETPDGPITAGTNRGFAVFKIESVDNTKFDDDFVLAPARLFVNQFMPAQAEGSVAKWYRRFGRVDPRFAQTMGVTSVPETKIPPGAKLDINTFVIIPISINKPSSEAEANQFGFELAYDSGGEAAYDAATGERGSQSQPGVNEGIVFTKTNPPGMKWSVIEDCKELSYK